MYVRTFWCLGVLYTVFACVYNQEAEFLEYIDSERLPPLLVDLFEKAQVSSTFVKCFTLTVGISLVNSRSRVLV